MSVFVVGAGIIGLPTAVYIQEKEPRAKVTLIAENFSANTTSDVAAGHWQPYSLADPREDLIKRWGDQTYQFLAELYRENAPKYGAGRLSGYELEKDEGIPFWADCVPDFRVLGQRELEKLGWGNFKYGSFFTSYYLESSKYLPVMLERFRSNGGKIEQRKLANLNELGGSADVIVNCSGLGAYYLVNDKTMYPIRGQVFKVRAPFMKQFIVAPNYYILPNQDVVTVGGTKQQGDWNTKVNPADSKDIWEGVTKVLPTIQHATILGEYVGLRPGRPTIRLETENTTIGAKSVPVVHSYGHGGSGITLHHGIALDGAALAVQALHMRTKGQAKL